MTMALPGKGCAPRAQRSPICIPIHLLDYEAQLPHWMCSLDSVAAWHASTLTPVHPPQTQAAA
jgi:hypothetical protein